MPKQTSVFRAVVLMGVLGWGVPMAVMFTLFHGTEDGENLLMRAATNVLIFGPLGAGFGLFMRKLMLHQQSAVASGAASGASRGSGSPAVLVVSTARLGLMAALLVLLLGPALIFVSRTQPLLAVVGLLPLAVGIHSLLWQVGTIRTDGRQIEVRTIASRFALPGNELTAVEVDRSQRLVALRAGARRLPVPSSLYWSGRDNDAMVAYIDDRLQKLAVPKEVRPWAYFAVPTGVRVRREAKAG
jgi:hypothetical protein